MHMAADSTCVPLRLLYHKLVLRKTVITTYLGIPSNKER